MRKQKERVVAIGETLKKGPWTADEDALLVEYVKSHGERQWNLVQKMGLRRCGKSCRLRWTNHLRPDLKKGAFSPDEEKIVIELHRRLGNKWSKIAAKLPGRTDNEVKNFWNTKIKRRLKNGSLEILQKNNNPDSILPPVNFQAPLFAPVNMDPNLNLNPDPLLNLSTTLCFNHPANASSSELGMNLMASSVMARDLIFHQSVPSRSLLSVSEELVSLYQNPNPFPGNNFQGFETNPSSHHVNALPYIGAQATYGIQLADGGPEMVETNANTSVFHYGDFSGYLLGDEGHDYSPSLGVENVTTRPDEGYQNLTNGGEMSSLLVGNDGSITDPTISSPCGLSSSESLGKQLLEVELESMDDELSSLLNTFSACGLPPDWYQTSGGDRILESTLTSYDPHHHDPCTLSSEPATASQAGHVLEH